MAIPQLNKLKNLEGKKCLYIEDYHLDFKSICNHILQLNEEFNSNPIATSRPRYFKDIQFIGVVGFFMGKPKTDTVLWE